MMKIFCCNVVVLLNGFDIGRQILGIKTIIFTDSPENIFIQRELQVWMKSEINTKLPI
jgi:hypothetical protein